MKSITLIFARRSLVWVFVKKAGTHSLFIFPQSLFSPNQEYFFTPKAEVAYE